MRLLARIIKVLPPQGGTSEKGEWTRQEFIIKTLASQYNETMVVSIFGKDKLQRLNLQEDQIYDMNLSFSAREWKGKYFNNIDVFSATLHETPAANGKSSGMSQEDAVFPNNSLPFDDDVPPF